MIHMCGLRQQSNEGQKDGGRKTISVDLLSDMKEPESLAWNELYSVAVGASGKQART